jgi:2-haloacid dehalogenase
VIKALLFDVFGTVVDWRTGVAREAKAFFDERGIAVDASAFADAWRAKYQPAMERVRAGNRGYLPLDVLHRENLDATLADFGLSALVDPAARANLNRAWEKLPPWPDSVMGLTRLKSGYAIAPCSNGSIALMTWLARYGGLPWDTVLGAEIARAYKPQPAVYLASASALGLGAYKPQPAVYLASASALGLAPAEAVMVAAHNDDLAAARAAGLKTAFVPRPSEHGPGQTADLEPDSDWDVMASDFNDLNCLYSEGAVPDTPVRFRPG